jgi:endonuclease/exonuclease/phosphatase family metal-dependent hydrolase
MCESGHAALWRQAVSKEGPMRKSFIVFLVGVVGGTLGLLLQNFEIRGLQNLQFESRSAPPSAEHDAHVPISTPAATNRNTIRVASFNIQVFGRTKIGKPTVMDVLTRIVRQFDVVAIQEIRSRDDDILPRFVDMLNGGERHFDFVIGPRLGRTDSTEQYAFIFDTQTLEVDRNQLYTLNDPDDVLHREPFVAWFRARGAPVDMAFTFSLVNIHTDPDEVEREIDALDDVIHAVRNDGRQEDDVILLGDFNADDRHFGQLGRVANILSAGTHQYDNIVFDRLATGEFTGRAGVFDFLRTFDLSLDAAQDVSDHLPVWAEFSVLEGGQYGRVARQLKREF